MTYRTCLDWYMLGAEVFHYEVLLSMFHAVCVELLGGMLFKQWIITIGQV